MTCDKPELKDITGQIDPRRAYIPCILTQNYIKGLISDIKLVIT